MCKSVLLFVLSSFFALWTGINAVQAGEMGMQVQNLRCEYHEVPLHVDTHYPRLSWQVESTRRGAAQSAFQILVASSPDILAREEGDLWDTRKVYADTSNMVPYDGAPLSPRTACYWIVRVWDELDQVTDWSAPAKWVTGMMEEAWPGDYIAMNPVDGNPEYPLLRKVIDLPREPVAARAYINALGYYELYLNGDKVDDHVLMPGPSQFNERSLYVVHDVTQHLKAGDNTFGLWLGRGWYTEEFPGVVHPGPVVRGFIEVTYHDGETQLFATGADWKAHPSHYSRIDRWFSHQYGGEAVDGRAILPDWAAVDHDDSSWYPVSLPEIPPHTVSAMLAEPNRAVRTMQPQEVIAENDGVWLVDFGTNLAGTFHMHFDDLMPDQELNFEFGDQYDGQKLESFNQRGQYIARGESGETYENRFNYHGFRYVRISGMENPPQPETITAKLVRTDYEVLSSFSCSNDLLNRIHDMVHYTLECLTLGGYQVDCPHAERLGYGGDGLASTPTAMKMHGMGPLYANWMAHWRDSQRPDGGLPHIAPNPHSAGGGPYWCSFVIGAPWEAYVQYGDQRMLDENYSTMQNWLDVYVAEYKEDDGLLMGWPNEYYRNWYLGDWARPHRNEAEAERSVHLVNNCVLVQSFDWMHHIAQVLGNPEDAERYAKERDALRQRIQEVFYDAERNTYADDTQLDLAYPLLVGVTPSDLRATILERLEHKILEEHDGHLDVGLVGVPILTTALRESGRNDLVYAYTSKETFPGWGFMLAEGATTTWEHWGGHRSHIHNCYNSIGEWFYTGIAGIRPKETAPGYKEFILSPDHMGRLDWARAQQKTAHGTIESHWRIENDVFHWDIRVPANTVAEVHLPTAKVSEIRESGENLEQIATITYLHDTPDRVVLRVAAGQYHFTVGVQKNN